jgi:hypothetical protein
MFKKIAKILLMGSGTMLIFLGTFLCLDSLLPKEKKVSPEALVIEFLSGLIFVATGISFWLIFRIKSTRLKPLRKRNPYRP